MALVALPQTSKYFIFTFFLDICNIFVAALTAALPAYLFISNVFGCPSDVRVLWFLAALLIPFLIRPIPLLLPSLWFPSSSSSSPTDSSLPIPSRLWLRMLGIFVRDLFSHFIERTTRRSTPLKLRMKSDLKLLPTLSSPPTSSILYALPNSVSHSIHRPSLSWLACTSFLVSPTLFLTSSTTLLPVYFFTVPSSSNRCCCWCYCLHECQGLLRDLSYL